MYIVRKHVFSGLKANNFNYIQNVENAGVLYSQAHRPHLNVATIRGGNMKLYQEYISWHFVKGLCTVTGAETDAVAEAIRGLDKRYFY